MKQAALYFMPPPESSGWVGAAGKLCRELRAACQRRLASWRADRSVYPPTPVPVVISKYDFSPADLALMRCELRLLLDRYPSARQVLHHLAFLEKSLDHDANRLLAQLPPPFMRKALAQLDVITDKSMRLGLARLKARLRSELRERE